MLLKRKLGVLLGTVYLFGGNKASAPAPAPIIEPQVQNAQFEAGEDDEDDNLRNRKKKGKSSLIVKKKSDVTTPATNKGSTTNAGAGLSVGR